MSATRKVDEQLILSGDWARWTCGLTQHHILYVLTCKLQLTRYLSSWKVSPIKDITIQLVQ